MKNYRKKNVQPMRPYVPGEDLTGISVNKEDTPELGGMIAVNPKNPEDKWYVAKKFFEENYEEATPTFSGGEKDEMEQRKEIAKLLFKRKDMIPNNSMWLAAEIQDLFIPKPIPAEKKECEDCQFYETCNKVNSANRKCSGFQPKDPSLKIGLSH